MIEHLRHRFRVPLAGKIRLGRMVESSKGTKHPQDLDHFVLPSELVERDPEHFKDPKSIDVMFHSDEIEDVFDSWYEVYSGRGGGAGGLLTLRCDGLNYEKIPKNVNEPIERGKCRRPLPEVGKPWPTCECGSQPKGKLTVMLVHGPVAFYRLIFGGHAQISQFWEDLKMRHAEFGGRLKGIPFQLVRRPETTSVPDKEGNRLAKVGHPVRLESSFTLREALSSRGIDPYRLLIQRALPGPIADEPHLDPYEDEDDDADGAATTARRDPNEEVRTAPSPSAEKTVAGPRADGAPPARRDGDEVVEDDESICFLLASELGIEEHDYRIYVLARYRKGQSGPLTNEQVKEQCEMFRSARSGDERSELHRRISVKVASLLAATKKKDG